MTDIKYVRRIGYGVGFFKSNGLQPTYFTFSSLIRTFKCSVIKEWGLLPH
jgi:hypothetical protein